MARVKQDLYRRLEPSGFINLVGDDYIYETLPTAVRAFVKYHRMRHGDFPDGVPREIIEP